MQTATHANGHAAPTHAFPDDGDAAPDDVFQLLRPDGTLVPGAKAPIDVAETTRLYVAMLRNRLVDERMVMLQRQGRIGFYIGSTGEEAAIIGPIGALRPTDWLFPCYRENGGYLLRGLPFQRFVDNLFGNVNDPVKGRQMPNHMSYRQLNIVSISSPIGTQIIQAAGAAHAAKLSGKDDVMLSYFGEGATSSNDFHTGLNFAGVYKSPVVFLLRNNGWAISVPREKQCAAETFAIKAEGYGFPGVRVDGNDLFAMWQASQDAYARARAGEGPTLIEAVTYRIQGHSTSDDPKVYRKDDVVEPWRRKDPIERVKKYLVSLGAWSDAQDEALRARIDDECKAAITVAEGSAPPALETVFEEVFHDLPWHLAEQLEESRAFAHLPKAADGAFPL